MARTKQPKVNYGFGKLLSIENDAKTIKGGIFGWLTAVMYLAPALEADGKTNMCTFATLECIFGCLYSAGRAKLFKTIKRARIARTLLFIRDSVAFYAKLRREIAAMVKRAAREQMKPCVRLNGTSDVPKIAWLMAAEFPELMFYDYTKIPKPWLRTRPNYHLTFSFSGSNLNEALEALAHDINVAVVFDSAEFPATWYGYRVINGDESDLRFLDPKRVVVGLKAKGDARNIVSGGFVQASKDPLIQITL